MPLGPVSAQRLIRVPDNIGQAPVAVGASLDDVTVGQDEDRDDEQQDPNRIQVFDSQQQQPR